MSKLPTPLKKKAILRAVEELKGLEMLDKDENFTSLGTTSAYFQLEPKFSKTLINAVIFKYVMPIMDIVILFLAGSSLLVSYVRKK